MNAYLIKKREWLHSAHRCAEYSHSFIYLACHALKAQLGISDWFTRSPSPCVWCRRTS